MKKIFNKFLVFFLAVSVFSCEDVDNTIYDVLDGVQRGAAIRTLEIVSANYNVFDPGSTFEIVALSTKYDNCTISLARNGAVLRDNC